jgi:aconitate hydratase
MGVLPLELPPGTSVDALGLTGHEVLEIRGLAGLGTGRRLPRELVATADGREVPVTVRIDTPKEEEYYRHGGILPYVARQLAAGTSSAGP